MILFFMIIQFRRIYQFKSQHDWLIAHPDRTIISRQFKKLGDMVNDFVAFVGDEVVDLDEAFANNHLAEDKNFSKSMGLSGISLIAKKGVSRLNCVV